MEAQIYKGDAKTKKTETEIRMLIRGGSDQEARGSGIREDMSQYSDKHNDFVRNVGSDLGKMQDVGELRGVDTDHKGLSTNEGLMQSGEKGTAETGSEFLMMEEEQGNLIVQMPWSEGKEEGTPALEPMNMETVGGPKVKEALVKQSRRILRVLRSPKKHRQPLKEMNTNTVRERKSDKRKGMLGELDIDIDEDNLQDGKRNNVDVVGNSSNSVEEREGSNPL